MAPHTIFVPERLQPTIKTGSFSVVGCGVRRSRSHLRLPSRPRRISFSTSICLSRLKTRFHRIARPPVGKGPERPSQAPGTAEAIGSLFVHLSTFFRLHSVMPQPGLPLQLRPY